MPIFIDSAEAGTHFEEGATQEGLNELFNRTRRMLLGLEEGRQLPLFPDQSSLQEVQPTPNATIK